MDIHTRVFLFEPGNCLAGVERGERYIGWRRVQHSCTNSITMGMWFSRLFSGLIGEQEYRILVLGLDNAGKTTILCKTVKEEARVDHVK